MKDQKPLTSFRVLVVDDERMYAQALAREINRRGLVCDTAFTGGQALEKVQNETYHAILLDHRLPDDDGIRLIPRLLARQPQASVIVMTAYDSIPSAIQAIRQGAEDYKVKETSLEPLVTAVLEVVERHRIHATQERWDEHRAGGLLGTSRAIARVREQLEKVANQRETTVLITGESGAGKEVASRYLHDLSVKGASPFVAVDCAALPATLIESILFGHEKGAFTGADRMQPGAFEEARDGTIFLDEVGDMDLALQARLLRVLERRVFQRVGSVREHPVKARIVAATNRDLSEAVKAGHFRFDLYQRLSVFPVHLPPLRERREDILVLARHFIAFYSAKMNVQIKPLSREMEHYLTSYDYPGNVRELKNIIERAVILADAGVIEPRHLPERMLNQYSASVPDPILHDHIAFVPGVDTLETMEVKMIRNALRQAGGVKSEAARLLGISRFQLMRRMEKYGIADQD